MTKKSFELTHRSKVMTVEYWEAPVHGQETIKGIISWTKNGYHESQGFHVAKRGNEQIKYIQFSPSSELSKLMKKEVGLKLEKIIIEGVEKS